MASRDKALYDNLEQELKKLINETSLDKVTSLLERIKKENSLYGLVWPTDQIKEKIPFSLESGYFPILKNIKDLEIKNPIDVNNSNVLVEGDNYHLLKILQATHQKKVNVIYIDPPYNTGNKDFKYNDNFVDEDDNYRHSKWLTFMEKRLKLARNLLSMDGVIFISIDNHEFAQLKLLCDEIFGERNFITNFVWKKKNGGGNDSKYVITEHEYVYVYARSIKKTFFKKDSKATVEMKYPFQDETGFYQLERLDKQSLGYQKTLDFPIYDVDKKKYLPHQKNIDTPNARWRWSQETVSQRYNELVFKNGHVYTKNYQKSEYLPGSILYDERFGRTQSGKILLKKILGKDMFSYPKPVDLIKHLLRISTHEKSIVLDFFAGSGTTAQAVLELNKEDGGQRRFILGTNNENNICIDVTYKRIKKVIEGYLKVASCDAGCQYLKIDFIQQEKCWKEEIQDFSFQKNIFFHLINIYLLQENKSFMNMILEHDNFKVYEGDQHHLFFIEDTDLFTEKIASKVKKIMNAKTKFIIFNFFHNNQFDLPDDKLLIERFVKKCSDAGIDIKTEQIEIGPKSIINNIIKGCV